MTVGKKILAAAACVLLLTVGALAAIPFVFKDRIEAVARTAIERTVDARVSWTGVGLTFFRDFPNLTLSLDTPSVVGVGAFEGDTLVTMRGFRLALDAGSVIRGLRGTGPVVVRSVRLDAPDVRLSVLPDGTANWDILHEEASAETPSQGTEGLSVALRALEITDGTLVLQDQATGLFASLSGLQHTLSGDLSQERVTVRTRTHADATTLRFAAVPYLEQVSLDFDADLDADLANGRVVLADNELRLNALAVRFSGSVARSGDDLALDLTFSAPQTEFSQVLSLVPGMYAQDFQALQTAGTFTLEGRAQGDWGTEAFPAFTLNADVSEGMFRYPDLPLPARDIAFHLGLENPGGDVDNTVVRVERFHMQLGEQPIDANLVLRTPVSDPDVDVGVRGTLDLADLARTIKLEGVEELSGVVRADAAVRARLSDVDAARWERVSASGDVTATGVTIRATALPHPVGIEQATLEFTPRRAELRALRTQLGSSDVQATGSLDNVLAYVLRGEELRGRATFTSGRFDLDEWRSDDPLQAIPVPAGIDMRLDGSVTRLTFSGIEMSNARGGLQVKDRRVTLDDFTMSGLGGRIGVNGFYETTDGALPTFGVSLALDSLDIPQASAALLTVRLLAPVARFARGTFTSRLDLSGSLGQDLSPVLSVLSGEGSLLTSNVGLNAFPALARLAEVLSLPQLANPTFQAIRSTIAIRDGRLSVRPFTVRLGDFRMAVSGSNGIDQSMDYSIALALPRSVLGGSADQALRTLITQAGRTGVDLQAADSVELTVGLTGTVTDPTLKTDFRGMVTSTGDRVMEAAGAALEQRLAAAQERVDSMTEAAQGRARERADSLVQDAEARAEAIKAEARKLADEVRAEANRRADQILAEAKNPVARVAAKAVADRIRKEADEKATAGVQEAERRADALVAEARARAEEVLRGG